MPTGQTRVLSTSTRSGCASTPLQTVKEKKTICSVQCKKVGCKICKDGAASLGWHADDEALFQGKFEDIRVLA